LIEGGLQTTWIKLSSQKRKKTRSLPTYIFTGQSPRERPRQISFSIETEPNERLDSLIT